MKKARKIGGRRGRRGPSRGLGLDFVTEIEPCGHSTGNRVVSSRFTVGSASGWVALVALAACSDGAEVRLRPRDTPADGVSLPTDVVDPNTVYPDPEPPWLTLPA